MRLFATALSLLAMASLASAQGKSGQIADNPQPVGEAGIAWYTTWESGLAEAKRSNRPIFFMSAATTTRGVSGCF